ncbi:hypothetical protein G5V59_10140 [Nocardioides sp. W3-2-3]|nr:hypothetical protein [Nocardioides convexus]
MGRASLLGDTLRIEGGWTAQRALYNVVRGADVANDKVQAVFGSTGFFCSDAARALIRDAGFKQARDRRPWRRLRRADPEPHQQLHGEPRQRRRHRLHPGLRRPDRCGFGHEPARGVLVGERVEREDSGAGVQGGLVRCDRWWHDHAARWCDHASERFGCGQEPAARGHEQP